MLKEIASRLRPLEGAENANTLTVREVWTDDRGLFCVNDWEAGTLLEQRRECSPTETAQLFRGTCEGVAFSHRRSVLHLGLGPFPQLFNLFFGRL